MKIFCRRVFQEEGTATRKDLQQNCPWQGCSKGVEDKVGVVDHGEPFKPMKGLLPREMRKHPRQCFELRNNTI